MISTTNEKQVCADEVVAIWQTMKLIVLILVVSAYFQPCSSIPVNGSFGHSAMWLLWCSLSVYNSTFIRQAINGANLVGCDVWFWNLGLLSKPVLSRAKLHSRLRGEWVFLMTRCKTRLQEPLRNFKISIYEDPDNPHMTPHKAFHALLKWWTHLDEPESWAAQKD